MKVLFVCTGNTCRSPMAEGIFRKMLREEGLEGRVLCQSAGLSAVEGEPPAENAVAACAEIGVDISGHVSRRVTGMELPRWDVFFTMSSTHAYILQQAGAISQNIYVPRLIEDPYGQDLTAYRRCRDMLERELKLFLREVVRPRLEGRMEPE